MYSYDGISSHQASGQILFQWPLHVWSRTRISWGQWGNPGIHGIYLGIYLDHHWQHQIYTKLFRYQKITQTHRGIELFQDFSRRKSSKINTFQLTRLFSMQYLIATLRSSYRATCIKRSEEIQGESGWMYQL